MLSLFKSKKSVKETIERIHNEFDTAGERLLQEAKQLLSNKPDTDKGDRLKALGFNYCKHVVDTEASRKQIERNKEVAERVEYFRMYYPNNKFITDEMVQKICAKYNLVCGPVYNYIGEVPLKNVAEMEAFKLRQEDMNCYTDLDRYQNQIYHQAMWKQHYQAAQMFANIGMRAFSSGIGAMQRPQYTPPSPSLTNNLDQIAQLRSQKTYTKEAFKICAPEKDFNTKYMTKRGHMLIPDPIVLQPVKGGYLIVSKWGLEASDEIVVNQGQN